MVMRFLVFAVVLARSVANAETDLAENKYFSTYTPAGLQSGPDTHGSTFVSSAVYSQKDNSVVLTGSTWGRFFESREQLVDEDYDQYGQEVTNPRIVNGCFMAVAALPGAKPYIMEGTTESSKQMFWSRKQRVRAPSANEACNAVHYFDDTSSVMVAGHSEERRNVTLTGTELVERTSQYGMLLDMDWNIQGDKSFKTVGGQLLKDSSVIYPVALTSRTTSEDDGLFVVFMEANQQARHINLAEGEQPKDPFDYFDYGAGFGMSVARFDLKMVKVTPNTSAKRIEQTWLNEYDTAKNNGEVYVSDIVHPTGGVLIVTGSTNGQGAAFGSETDQGKDMDGFVSKISPTTGKLLVDPGFPSSVRIQSTTRHANDWITGVCHDENQHDATHIYIAGMTEGLLSGSNADRHHIKGTSAFIMKLDTKTLQPVWTRQFGSQTTGMFGTRIARGMACAVNPLGDAVWLGGVVEHGGVISESGLSGSFGGKDIFVAKLQVATGATDLVKQMGTNRDDELALRGGLVCDSDGNAVLIGNTYGSFYRERASAETASDVFILTVSAFTGESVSSLAKEGGRSAGAKFGLFILSCLVIALASTSYMALTRRHGKDTAPTDRSKVTGYLGDFDLEDIELKHSATGGWHCNFVNKLAHGHFSSRGNRPPLASNNSGELAELANGLMGHSPASEETEDLMFCDAHNYMDSSARSHSSSGMLHGGDVDSEYGELVSAYNSTWSGKSRKRNKAAENKKSPAWGKDII